MKETISQENIWDKKRAHKRILIEKATEINSCESRIKNISPSGMMVTSSKLPEDGPIKIVMEIDGSQVTMKGQVVWSTDKAHENCFDMGIYITEAPPEYMQFVDNLYLEIKDNLIN